VEAVLDDGERVAVVEIPAGAADAVLARVDRCSAHGGSATARHAMALQSRPALSGARALSGNAAAAAGRLGEHAAKVRVTRIGGWPLCARCARTRRRWLAVAAVCFWGGLALVLGSVAVAIVDGRSGQLGIPLYTGIALLIVSPAPFVRGSLPRVVGARTSDDGTTVVVRDAHPRFAAQVADARRDVRTPPVDTTVRGE